MPKPVLPETNLPLPGTHIEKGKRFAAEYRRPLTDVGNAERVRDLFGNYFRAIKTGGKSIWYVWNGEIWIEDQWNLIQHAVRLTLSNIYAEAQAIQPEGYVKPEKPKKGETPLPVTPDDELAAMAMETARWARDCQFDPRHSACLRQLASVTQMTCTLADFDMRPEWLNTRSGVLDLESLAADGLTDDALMPHHAMYMCRKQVGASFDTLARCPRWIASLRECFDHSQDMVDYLQLIVGYALSGNPIHKRMFAMYGTHDTGKSFILNVLSALFGTYAKNAAGSVLRVHDGMHPLNDVHSLMGARFVTTSETGRGDKLDLPLVKRMTGRDELTTRDLYQSNVSWYPTFVILNASNESMEFPTSDTAMARRLKAISLTVQFSEDGSSGHKAIPDLDRQIIDDELDGILNWAIEGYLRLLREGMTEPGEVVISSLEYRSDADPVLRFLLEYIEDGYIVQDTTVPISHCMSLHDMYLQFTGWCLDEKTSGCGKHEFSKRLEAAGYTKVNSGGWKWVGLVAGATY